MNFLFVLSHCREGANLTESGNSYKHCIARKSRKTDPRGMGLYMSAKVVLLKACIKTGIRISKDGLPDPFFHVERG